MTHMTAFSGFSILNIKEGSPEIMKLVITNLNKDTDVIKSRHGAQVLYYYEL
jgi:hypothetical protein